MQAEIPDRIEGLESRPVPGFPAYRVDDRGKLWRFDGFEWVWFGRGPKNRTTLCDGTGHKVSMPKHKAACMAWHGERPKRCQVRFRDGDPANLKPDNLYWLDVEPRAQPRTETDPAAQPERQPQPQPAAHQPEPEARPEPEPEPEAAGEVVRRVVVEFWGLRVTVEFAPKGAPCGF